MIDATFLLGWTEGRIRPSYAQEPLRLVCSEMPGMRWDADKREWCGPLEGIEIIAEKLGLDIGSDFQGRLAKSCQATFPFDDERLEDWQREEIRFLLSRLDMFHAAMLVGPPPLAPQALLAARAAGAYKVIVVTEPGRVDDWLAAIPKWLGEITASPLREDRLQQGASRVGKKVGKLTKLAWRGVGVTTWDELKGREIRDDGESGVQLEPCNFIILDGLEQIASGLSKRADAIRRYITRGGGFTSEGKPARPRIIGLAERLDFSRPRMLWNPLDTLFPGRWGGYRKFTGVYADGQFVSVPTGTAWMADGATNIEELKRRVGVVAKTRKVAPTEVADDLLLAIRESGRMAT